MLLFFLLSGLAANFDLSAAQIGGTLDSRMMRLLGQTSDLQVVVLRYHNLSRVEKSAFDGFAQLTRLDLSHNQISTIDDSSFLNLTNLNLLDLSFNRIPSVKQSLFRRLTKLAYLLIESNSIINIPANTLTGLVSLRQVCLSNNPVDDFFAGSLIALYQSNRNLIVISNQSCYDQESLPTTLVTSSTPETITSVPGV